MSNSKVKKEVDKIIHKRKMEHEVCVSNRRLEDIPESVLELTGVKELFLCHDMLERIPEQLGKMRKLEVLNLTWNRIKSLPNRIFELTNLQILDLSHNMLSVIPDDFDQFMALKSLAINNNHIEVLPDSICELEELQVLHCGYNRLSAFPAKFNKLLNLERLYANNNRITSFPEYPDILKKLATVSLHNNRIKEIPESVSEMKRLKNLQLSSNKIESVPLSLANCTRLEELNLLGNPMAYPGLEICSGGLTAIVNFLKEKLAASTHGKKKHANECASIGLSSALLKNGNVFMWGDEKDDFYETEMLTFGNRPKRVKYPQPIIHISVGWYHILAVSETGQVFSFGDGEDGKLGLGDIEPRKRPSEVILPGKRHNKSLACSAGAHHSLSLSTNGHVLSWGRGIDGQLGHGDTCGLRKPKIVDALSKVKCLQVIAGRKSSYAISKDGDLYAWGSNEGGLLGINEEETALPYSKEPVNIRQFKTERISQVSIGITHAAALSESGLVYTWGVGKHGQLGRGPRESSCRPEVVNKLVGHRIRFIACGGNFTFAISASGEIYFFGRRMDGLKESSPMIQAQFSNLEVSSISTGGDHALFFTTNGEVFSWGSSKGGKLGLGVELSDVVKYPALVAGFEGLVVTGWRRSRKAK